MAKEKKIKKAGKGLWAEFKEFINRGNAFMLAVGVVIGGAFGAIVTTFVNMLLSVSTWAVPGGLKGLVTVLPALNDAQRGLAGVGQQFAKADYDAMAKLIGENAGLTGGDAMLYGSNVLNSNYTAHGGTFCYNGSAVIDWGALLTAVISFIIIALVLFIIVKVTNNIAKKREALQAKAREEYYKKHPEERPAPVEEGAPAPTTEELLTQIRDLLAEKK